MSDIDEITLRHPTAVDGRHVHALVAANPPLDPNSVYCNLLQCSHFASTAVAAFKGEQMVGFVSGYIPPEQPHVLFVWQLLVDAAGRGQGLAKRLVKAQLNGEACQQVTHIHTTITADNDASWGVFKSLAKEWGAELTHDVYFDKDAHFGGEHDSEHLLEIGPIAR
ncbi:diaminobutyrate acetyltransferase [Gilvimarinus agarilyticus]|uniref:diaminobutyrate acetyltransferase n=1 Tax=unclassified Gilvimarinus TaxID=2642066 RepID=UPI001C08ECB0|nr:MULTISPECIES: diaminobutyrate acetyltransferase [unclassified Gilvimarinus]MBU2885175.1 diaminobutyrate acetyltransferase [Gilvimarinus agarilyticus]MDO6570074.1 diaminobutyrate acetyltransferase [Gilvimarinus sp. 2_MG-2023]MDO6745625.1 diaminobutyrate acetyltransferase [Gilvimarinus sp. 1_MG-2023]